MFPSNDPILSRWTRPLRETGSRSSAKISCNLVTFYDAFEGNVSATLEVFGFFFFMPLFHKDFTACGALGVTL